MTFWHFNVSTVGIELNETLHELLIANVINQDILNIIKMEFQVAFLSSLKKKIKDKPILKGKLLHYQNCDNVWMFFVTNPEIKNNNYSLPINLKKPLKIVAYDNKNTKNLKRGKNDFLKKKLKKNLLSK
ncbi:transcription initiation factor IIA gamma chain [Guillardia theta]|uniref:Transcription initiation factor IIA gamma chain n=1 Tax=Guillardia theta TaxID=55529 RepID=Q9XG36_GUITH|nr:transcription initiation factor IIA gamma chain [Guillardia theta]CAB40402.1 transcription initiation factor IIA gamma chain [Guillardia theta]|mmetsp:Transcript_3197/g.10813  ORF Transcript_3197/g.10813 Transcript_3197/m.10813 type:complete len:129 (-) Transcript_3197:965-1351(-)